MTHGVYCVHGSLLFLSIVSHTFTVNKAVQQKSEELKKKKKLNNILYHGKLNMKNVQKSCLNV